MAKSFNAVVVRQWLQEWDSIDFDANAFQSEPPKDFLVTSIPARTLRELSNTYRRESGGAATGIQRKHDESRSEEIARFVREGYPLSSISPGRRASVPENLQKPGWLPSAIVVNILDPQNPRAGRQVSPADALRLPPLSEWVRGDAIELTLPSSWSDGDWKPSGAFPIEVIDGQHRLWSFVEGDEDLEYDLPVVAFYGLDISWQAYLFWTINIKPKKINASLAYDLYPLLRDQEWLRQGEGLDVYRETRAQELTEVLWATPESPWYRRINMLGATGVRAQMPVTQSAFVRSLSESLVRPWKSRGSSIGGLYGGSPDGGGLYWTRAQQGAFLLTVWRELAAAVVRTTAAWATRLRPTGDDSADGAFSGPYTLLSADQGIRAFHQVVNDIFYVASTELNLKGWERSTTLDDTSADAIDAETGAIDLQGFRSVITTIGTILASFDWRSSRADGLEPEERLFKQSLRGTGGYKLLRDELLKHLSRESEGDLARWVNAVVEVRV
ncbi:DGQHR domain-containing protein [Curtobacterium flaccumfaciens pv. flaccumfaciens]|uniref:DGQHR domain-containing protein n=1 Tax=Curtobacterium flaccumfaciens TaxID=2035 RepID=UPI0039A31FFE